MSNQEREDAQSPNPENIEKWKTFGAISWQQRRIQRMYVRVINKAVQRYPQYHVAQLLRLQDMIFDTECDTMDRIDLADITRLTGDSPQATSRSLRLLEQEGLIERNSYPEDRRRTYVLVTERGKDILKDCGQEIWAYSCQIIEDLGMEKLIRIRESMEELFEAMTRKLPGDED